MAVFILSDTHFCHKRIINFERFKFKTIEEHDEYIIEKWNQTIKESDIVYHLGDVIFPNSQYNLKDILSKLNGYKILIRGNHDKKTNTYYLNNGFNEVYNHPIYIKENVILSHEPVLEAYNNPYVYNIHGHLHGAKLDLDNFMCVALDQINYIPLNLEKVISKLILMNKRRESFLNEWYVKFYKFYIDKKNITDEEGKIYPEKIKNSVFKKIILTYDEMELLNSMCDFSSRLLAGQFEEFLFKPIFFNVKDRKEIESILSCMKEKYDGMDLHARYGVYCGETPEISKVLYDVHQKIRYMIYLNNKERYKDTFYENTFLKSSNKNEIYIEEVKSKFKFHIPLSIINDLLLGIDVFRACSIWNIPVLNKYLEIYTIKKGGKVSYVDNLFSLQKFHKRNEELNATLKSLRKKLENINHL